MCKYCRTDGKRARFEEGTREKWTAYIDSLYGSNTLEIEYDDLGMYDGESLSTDFDINYCPMCGRNLCDTKGTKVKLLRNYRLEDDEMQPMVFSKGDILEVVHTFEDESWGLDDHTVFVVISKEGYTLSLSKEVVEEVR